MVAALTISVDSSIGVGFASAAGLIATSNATDIQGFIGLASLLNAEGHFSLCRIRDSAYRQPVT
jgi:hypothetical protein